MTTGSATAKNTAGLSAIIEENPASAGLVDWPG
jgi:hypothetical protein